MSPVELDAARTIRSLLVGQGQRLEEARLRSLAWSSWWWHQAFACYRLATTLAEIHLDPLEAE
jgi:hypothetical protein